MNCFAECYTNTKPHLVSLRFEVSHKSFDRRGNCRSKALQPSHQTIPQHTKFRRQKKKLGQETDTLFRGQSGQSPETKNTNVSQYIAQGEERSRGVQEEGHGAHYTTKGTRSPQRGCGRRHRAHLGQLGVWSGPPRRSPQTRHHNLGSRPGI